MSGMSELEKFTAKHLPKLKKSGGKFLNDVKTAGHEGGFLAGKLLKDKAKEIGKAAAREVANHPILSAGVTTTAATGLAAGGEDDAHTRKASEAGKALRAHRDRKKRPEYLDED